MTWPLFFLFAWSCWIKWIYISKFIACWVGYVRIHLSPYEMITTRTEKENSRRDALPSVGDYFISRFQPTVADMHPIPNRYYDKGIFCIIRKPPFRKPHLHLHFLHLLHF